MPQCGLELLGCGCWISVSPGSWHHVERCSWDGHSGYISCGAPCCYPFLGTWIGNEDRPHSVPGTGVVAGIKGSYSHRKYLIRSQLPRGAASHAGDLGGTKRQYTGSPAFIIVFVFPQTLVFDERGTKDYTLCIST